MFRQNFHHYYSSAKSEDNPLYGIVADNLETHLAMQFARDRPVPFFIEYANC